MAGKSTEEMKSESDNSENSDPIQGASAESILPRQNGSPLETQDGGSGVAKSVSENLPEENACMNNSESNSVKKYEVILDMIRNKLIYDFSSAIFRSNIGSEINKMDPTRINSERLSVIEELLVQIYLLSDSEKLLLYLKLPNSLNSIADPLSQPLNMLGNWQEIQQAIIWMKTHLEEDKEKPISKQDVYDEYLKYCRNASVKPLSIADFWKIVKQVYPEVSTRILGIRGNSRYSYSRMGNTNKAPTPFLPRSSSQSNIPSISGRSDYCLLSTEIEESKSENYKKWKRPTNIFNTPSATVVRDPAPKDSRGENSTTKNEDTKDPVAERNFTNNLNPGTENRNDLTQPFNDFDAYNSGPRNGFDISSENVDQVMRSDFADDNINSDLPDKTELQKEESNVKRQNVADKSNAANTTLGLESVEPKPNNFIVAKLPLRVIKRIASTTALKRLNNPKTLRHQRARNSLRLQRSRGHRARLLPQSQIYRRRNYVSVRPKPSDGGTYWLRIYLGLRNKRNELSDVTGTEEETVKYFKHLEDTELLGAIGGTIVDELLKPDIFSGNIFNSYINVQGIITQSYLENGSETRTPFGNTVQEVFPLRSQNRIENFGEPTATFQGQDSIEYIPQRNLWLMENMENTVDANTDELNTQNNAVFDRRSENVSVSPSVNYFQFVPISPIPRTPMINPGGNLFLSPNAQTQTMPNNNILPYNNGFLPYNNNFIPQNNNFVPPFNNFIPPNNNFSSPNNNLSSPTNNLSSPTNNLSSPNNNLSSPNNNFSSPNYNLSSPNNNFSSPNYNFSSPNYNFSSPNYNFSSPNNNFSSPNYNFSSPTNNFSSPYNNFSSPYNNFSSPNNNFPSPNYNFPSPTNNFPSPNNNFPSPNYNFPSPNNYFSSPNNIFLPADNISPPNNNFFLPNNDFLPPSNNFVSPNNALPQNYDFLPPNCNFLLPDNNVLLQNNSFLSPNSGFLPPNNGFLPPNIADPNSFNIVNMGILNNGLNEQNMIPGGIFPNPIPNLWPRNDSTNFFFTGTRDNSPELVNFDHFMPNEINCNQVDMESMSVRTDSPLLNFSGDSDEIIVDQPNFDDPQTSNFRPQSVPVHNITDSAFWFPHSNDTENIFNEYFREPTNQLDSNEFDFEPISDCQNMEESIEHEPFPDISLDDLAEDSNDENDQIFVDNYAPNPNNADFDDNSLNTLPDEIDDDVFESPNENANSYFESSDGRVTQPNPFFQPEAGGVNWFDNLFDDDFGNPTDPTMTAATPASMNESASHDESPASNFFTYGDSIDRELDEYLGFN